VVLISCVASPSCQCLRLALEYGILQILQSCDIQQAGCVDSQDMGHQSQLPILIVGLT
jgi:hypothetical protein